MPKLVGPGFPVVGLAACAAQRFPAGAYPKSTSSVRLCLSSGRNFGFLHPNCKRLIALLHVLLKFAPGRALAWVKERPPFLCERCGAMMAIVKTRIRPGIAALRPVPIVTQEVH